MCWFCKISLDNFPYQKKVLIASSLLLASRKTQSATLGGFEEWFMRPVFHEHSQGGVAQADRLQMPCSCLVQEAGSDRLENPTRFMWLRCVTSLATIAGYICTTKACLIFLQDAPWAYMNLQHKWGGATLIPWRKRLQQICADALRMELKHSSS